MKRSSIAPIIVINSSQEQALNARIRRGLTDEKPFLMPGEKFKISLSEGICVQSGFSPPSSTLDTPHLYKEFISPLQQ